MPAWEITVYSSHSHLKNKDQVNRLQLFLNNPSSDILPTQKIGLDLSLWCSAGNNPKEPMSFSNLPTTTINEIKTASAISQRQVSFNCLLCSFTGYYACFMEGNQFHHLQYKITSQTSQKYTQTFFLHINPYTVLGTSYMFQEQKHFSVLFSNDLLTNIEVSC